SDQAGARPEEHHEPREDLQPLNWPQLRWQSPQRLLLLALATALALAAVFPDFALYPVRSLVAQMRSPAQAAPVARAFLIAASAASVFAALLWNSLSRTVAV